MNNFFFFLFWFFGLADICDGPVIIFKSSPPFSLQQEYLFNVSASNFSVQIMNQLFFFLFPFYFIFFCWLWRIRNWLVTAYLMFWSVMSDCVWCFVCVRMKIEDQVERRDERRGEVFTFTMERQIRSRVKERERKKNWSTCGGESCIQSHCWSVPWSNTITMFLVDERELWSPRDPSAIVNQIIFLIRF